MARRTILSVEVEDIEKRRYPSKHYVYVIAVSWSDGAVNIVYRRYSKFFELQSTLLDNFPVEGGGKNPADRVIPFLPGKVLFGRSHVRQVALKRLAPINDYCKALIHLPSQVSECGAVHEFFEAHPEDLMSDRQIEKRNAQQRKEIKRSEITEPILLEQYLVVADYQKEPGTNGHEVSLTAGSLVEVVEKTDKGWWFVSSDQGQGWVASSYLEKQGGEEDRRDLGVRDKDAKKYVCTQPYTPQLPDEIKLDKGGIVEVLQRNLDGWWLVRYKGKTGCAPALYLNRTDTLKANRLRGREPKLAVQMITNVMSLSENQSEGASRGTPAIQNPATKAKTPKAGQAGTNQNPDSSAWMKQPHQTHQHWQKEKGRSKTPDTSPKPHHHLLHVPHQVAALSDSGSSGNESSPVAVRKNAPPPRRGTLKIQAVAPVVVAPTVEPVYVAIADFINQAQDGIDLKEGACVEVIDRSGTGWWYVKTNGIEGWAPESYIEKQLLPKQKVKPARPPRPATRPQDAGRSQSPANNLQDTARAQSPANKLQDTARAQSPANKLQETARAQSSSVDQTASPGSVRHAAAGVKNLAAELQQKLALRSTNVNNSNANDINNSGITAHHISRSNALKMKASSQSAAGSRTQADDGLDYEDVGDCDVDSDDSMDYEIMEDNGGAPPGLPVYQNIPQEGATVARNLRQSDVQTKEDVHDYIDIIEEQQASRQNPVDSHPESDDEHDYVNDREYVNISKDHAAGQREIPISTQPREAGGKPAKGNVAGLIAALGPQIAMGAKPKILQKPAT